MNDKRTVDYLNFVFDRQIKQELEEESEPISFVSKAIFNLTLNWTIDDWKKMRSEKYYEEISKYSRPYLKKQYKLNKIKEYLEQ